MRGWRTRVLFRRRLAGFQPFIHFSLILLGVVNIFFTCWLHFLVGGAGRARVYFFRGPLPGFSHSFDLGGGLNFIFIIYVVNFISAGFCIPSCSYFRFM